MKLYKKDFDFAKYSYELRHPKEGDCFLGFGGWTKALADVCMEHVCRTPKVKSKTKKVNQEKLIESSKYDYTITFPDKGQEFFEIASGVWSKAKYNHASKSLVRIPKPPKVRYKRLKPGQILKRGDQVRGLMDGKWITIESPGYFVNKLVPINFSFRRKVDNKTKK